jgi:hypothetical protein
VPPVTVELGGNGVNNSFHKLIERQLERRGIPLWPQTSSGNGARKGFPDVDLFGYAGEIKTASSYDISSNRSYAEAIDPNAERLMIAAYFDARTVDGVAMAVPYLICAGFIGPNDYAAPAELPPGQSRDAVQITKLLPEAYGKFDTIWIDEFDNLPAHLVPNVGKGGGPLKRLGNPRTIGELRAAAEAAKDARMLANLDGLTLADLGGMEGGLRWFDPSVRYPAHPKLRLELSRPTEG